jgi:hypothetical protein
VAQDEADHVCRPWRAEEHASEDRRGQGEYGGIYVDFREPRDAAFGRERKRGGDTPIVRGGSLPLHR